MNDRLVLNVTGYAYDYKGYQVSQIIDRSAINENFDSTMFGFEFETQFRPTAALAVNANIGLQKTRIGKDQFSLDVLNHTQGNPDYIVVKAFPILPSNCVIKLETLIRNGFYGDTGALQNCPGYAVFPGINYDNEPDVYPNGGRGFYANVGGNELPNAPKFTANVGIEYTIPFSDSWFVIPRLDVYHQSQSWARVYNTVADRLRGWENVNISLRIGNPDKDILFEAYVKNLFDASPILDTFVNSDDTGLQTNVFTLDPRVVGINISKKF